jgi:DNA-binding MarR family transcriptional regulator
MQSRNNVQITHISSQLRELHSALIDIVSVMNRPQRDEAMVREAGISLDRALFPLLVMVERLGPIGVVDLADRVGRDYTTVSRQVAKLRTLGLVDRQENAADRRSRETLITPAGKAMTDRVDEARERMGLAIFESWPSDEVDQFVTLMRKFATAVSKEA